MEQIYNGNANAGGIYKITNKINQKFYIGSTTIFKRRYQDHLKSLRRGRHKNRYLQDDYNIFGENNFVFEVIEVVNSTRYKINSAENKWLLAYYDNQNMYYNKSKKSNKRRKKRKTPIKQKPRTLAQRRKFSGIMKALWQNPEYANNQRKSLFDANTKIEKANKQRIKIIDFHLKNPDILEKFKKSRIGLEPWNKGRKATVEECSKNSSAQKEYLKNNPQALELLKTRNIGKKDNEQVIANKRNASKTKKEIIAINTFTGEEILFPSLKNAEENLGIANASIYCVLKGKQKQAKGWTFVRPGTLIRIPSIQDVASVLI